MGAQTRSKPPSVWLLFFISRIQKNSTGDNNFVKWRGTFPSDQPKWSDRSKWPPSKLVPNIPAGPNQNGPFHLMYQPKFPEFWVEWKAPTLSVFILASELVFDYLFTCSWPMQLLAVLQFSKENSLSAQGAVCVVVFDLIRCTQLLFNKTLHCLDHDKMLYSVIELRWDREVAFL